MSLLGAVADALTSGIDQFVGGQLTKATLECTADLDPKAKLKGKKVTFQFNPQTISIKRQSPNVSTAVQGATDRGSTQQASPTPERESKITLAPIFFDTYEKKPNSSVYTDYIKLLEQFTGYDQGKHAPVQLVFNWGKFTSERDGNRALECYIESLDVEYTMFLNDGMPVRAKCTIGLKFGSLPAKQQQQEGFESPDHAKLVTVKRGETLADIAWEEYDNPAEWRRIADANGIDDPMSLTPGMKLLVPPILS